MDRRSHLPLFVPASPLLQPPETSLPPSSQEAVKVHYWRSAYVLPDGVAIWGQPKRLVRSEARRCSIRQRRSQTLTRPTPLWCCGVRINTPGSLGFLSTFSHTLPQWTRFARFTGRGNELARPCHVEARIETAVLVLARSATARADAVDIRNSIRRTADGDIVSDHGITALSSTGLSPVLRGVPSRELEPGPRWCGPARLRMPVLMREPE